MPTVQDALQHMGIDYADDVVMANVQRALKTAEKTLQGAVGEDVHTLMPADPRAEELQLIYTDDLYSERGINAKVSAATRQLVATMELQLKTELTRLREKEAAGA